jgi:Mg-chelatase subunit ChlI
MDSLYADAEARALQQYIADSIYKIVYNDFRHVYDSVLAVRTAEEKMAQIEQTKKDIETLKAEAEQQGEALFEVEPGKTKKDKKAKKEKKSKKKDEEEQQATEEVSDDNATEQEQAMLNNARKEDNDEV